MNRILVAEDEVHIARAILTILKKGLPSFEIDHARDGEEAMAKLLLDDYALIISDWNMPKINGDELLANVRASKKDGKIPFIMLTARGDRDSVVAALKAGAQDFVVKPFKAEDLILKVNRLLKQPDNTTPNQGATETKPDSIINEIIKRFKSGNVTLPVLPDMAIKVNELFEGDEVNVECLAKVIESDAAISSKLINVANSPLVRGSSTCVSVEQAIVRLGLSGARNYIFTAASKGVFQTDNKALQGVMNRLWEHSLASAYCAKLIAIKLKTPRPEKMFMLGLLHDIGKLFLVSVINDLSKSRGGFTDESIAQLLDKLHSEFGQALLKSWHYDQEFQDVARYHHHPFDAPKVTQVLLIIYFANLMAHKIEVEYGDDDIAELAKSVAAKKLDITADTIEILLAETAINLAAAKNVL